MKKIKNYMTVKTTSIEDLDRFVNDMIMDKQFKWQPFGNLVINGDDFKDSMLFYQTMVTYDD